MKNFLRILLIAILCLCIPVSIVSAEDSSKETEEQTRALYVPVSKTVTLSINGTTITVTISGYVLVNAATGVVESWSLSASCSPGSIINQSYSASGNQVKCTIAISYAGLPRTTVIYVP